ncbi:hypothetical protein [Alteromonas sp. CYL-A6]|uniref:hypothetical protein n=1 Tax=Alteromonas nitratireducens TaxID=3390813 RepID=UPI0034C22095
MTLYEPKHQLSNIIDYCRDNPGFTLSIAYVLLTLCGIFYSDAFYGEFSIPYLKLAESSDLLIVGLGEPAALFMFVGALILAWLVDYLTVKSFEIRQRWLQKPGSVVQRLVTIILYTPKHRESVMFGIILAFVLYGMMFVTLYAEWQAEQVKAGKGQRIVAAMQEASGSHDTILLGSTANYLFVYSVDGKQSHIYSVQNIQSLQPELHQKPSNTDTR